MSGQIRVRAVDVIAEAEWSFQSSQPTLRLDPHGLSGTFDPFPCYPHDASVVADAVAHVTACCTPLWDVDLVIADREDVHRTNGWSSLDEGGRYVDGEWVKGAPTGLVLLSGKRIPPHPATTRYLVAHELGHQAEWMINHVRGGRHPSDGTLIADYARLRGLPDDVHNGSGGRWHNAADEVFACDFRILVCDVDPAYWPHPGVTHPYDLPDELIVWWADATAELSEAST